MQVGTHLSSQQMDDLKGMLDNAHSHQFLAIVAAMHHHGVGQTLHDGTLGLAETFGSITSSGVWQVLGVFLLHSNVIL